MRYDTVIMGGGLSGLMCGIALCKAGQRVAIVTSGQSSLHFNGGSLELLGYVDGQPVTHPLESINQLPAGHPYQKLGAERIAALAHEAALVLADAGLHTTGNANENHCRISPMGVMLPAWLTLEGYVALPMGKDCPWRRVLMVNVEGYLDFPVDFVVSGLRKQGLDVVVADVVTDELEQRRHTPSEMRATQLAKVLSTRVATEHLADAINVAAVDVDAILLPAIIGLTDDSLERLRQLVKLPLHLVATLPPSVAGTRMQAQLRHYFQMLGGTYLLGDTVTCASFNGDAVASVETEKLGDMPLRATHFVLATGSFMSKGLAANFERVYEPVMNLDVDADGSRSEWTRYDVLEPQPYMTYGVATTADFHVVKGGKPVPNVFAIGSVLSGHDAVKNHDGTGVSALTGLAVAHNILGK
ncbi:MAG: glycerol-3-phosphate dehydrogenase subunit GlpB [Muribaculaceae bacterium]|nr:glycerol-3-phosphate dehydrogenase subunit GlpB [Muribaculaceae bacterium]